MNAIADRPAIFSPFTDVIAAQSTRHGGLSAFPYESLNMGFSSGDAEENVIRNRERFFSSLGIHASGVAWSGQVHGTEILHAQSGGKNSGYDALITNKAGVFVAVGIADCCPVLIYDRKNNAVAAIHAGWRGTVANIVTRTLERMYQEFGTQTKHCYAYIGACISACSFEVGPEVAGQFDSGFVRWDGQIQKHFIDLKKSNLQQLLAMGVPPLQTEISPACTIINNDRYFSYRKEGKLSGRMLALIGIKKQ